MKTIPKSVSAMMTHQWKTNWTDAFELIFNPDDEYYRRRIFDPPYYIYRRADVGNEDVFSYKEAIAFAQDLRKAGFRVSENELANAAINEHVQHAYSDFMGEVYKAWDKFTDRLELVERAGRPLAAIPK